MKQRMVTPEILDGLAPDDPAAMRSRRDLRLIHFLMGNEKWMLRQLKRFARDAEAGIHEWGAGDGTFLLQIARTFPRTPITAVDLAPRPAGLADPIKWQQGDLLENPDAEAGILVANMFLHHFEGQSLKRLGEKCHRFRVLIFNEPNRSPLALLWSALLFPLVGRVTRHDMPASIRAGFRHGELTEWLGLRANEWQITETSTWRGARRVVAWRT